MTEPHFPTLTNSKPFASFPFEQKEEYGYLSTKFENGFQELTADFQLPNRTFTYASNCISATDLDKIMGFLRERGSGGQGFYINNPGNTIWPPWDAPTLSQTAGGAIGQTTYYARFSWATSTTETTCNGYGEASKVVAVNNYLTVQVPGFPDGVDRAKLYIATSSGAEKYTGIITTSCGIWTQDSATTTVNGQSNSGQKVLLVAATANFQVGDAVRVDESGHARDEVCVVASIQAGTSLTMEENLTYTHTAAQADPVATVVGAGASMPTSNTMTSEELYVHLMGPAVPIMRGRAWSLSLELEGMK